MITLSFDSTAKVASVAVSDSDRLLALYSIDNGLTQSELLLTMARDMLSSLHLKFSDVELLAASVGPGSFTGVRIGTALVKGIAFSKGIPCASVSTLEALAENLYGIEAVIVPAMDARRSQLYTAIFEFKDEKMIRHTEDMAISISDLAERLKEFEGKPIYIVGDGYEVASRELANAGIKLSVTPRLLRDQNAFSVAKVATKLHNEGKTTDDIAHLPTYLRIPQAERERLQKENNKNNI
jgi:tRNA threonylcarbamoyladenosine biosynthesis protein TsaB